MRSPCVILVVWLLLPVQQPDADTARLDQYQRIIENTEDSDATRTLQARELVQRATPESVKRVGALLRSSEPTTQVIVCRAMASIGRENPRRLADAWVEPLIALMASPQPAVASAAGKALAEYRRQDVYDRLAAIAGTPKAPPAQRQAALLALEPNTDQRRVVGKLVGLLDSDAPPIVAGVLRVLRQLSATDFGDDLDAWRRWWQTQQQKGESEWLEDQARHLARQARGTREELESAQREWQRERKRLARELSEALATNYRLTPPQERESLLENWLADARREYRQAATQLVAERISEGVLPRETLRSALRALFADPDPAIRKSAIETIAALNDPNDADAMLARLSLERVDTVRESLLRALGKLRNESAIGPLVAELERPDASLACVAAAADALAILASRGVITDASRTAMIAPLKSRFASLAPDARQARIALLEAMAALGDPAFKPEFEANLGAADAELLLRAIQGAADVGNGEQLGRLLGLLAHPDARVRQRAIDAVGKLGGIEQLDSVAARLDPDVEPLEEPRDAAWRAFRAITSRLPTEEQFSAADRLSKRPRLRAEYLANLLKTLQQSDPNSPLIDNVGQALAQTYAGLDRPCDAMTLWQRAHDRARQTDDPTRVRLAMKLLKSATACKRAEVVAIALETIAGADDQDRQDAETTVIDRLSACDPGDPFISGLLESVATVAGASYPRLAQALKDAPKSPTGTGPAPDATDQSD